MSSDNNQLNELEIRKRLDHLGFTESDAQLLKSLKPWAQTAISEFAHEFYEVQFRNPDFVAIIRANNSTQQILEGAQAGYAMDLFNGYPDSAYVQKRVSIGALHARINITPQWYLASYKFYHDILYPMVRSQFVGSARS